MPLPSKSLEAIQITGTAAFNAQKVLNNSVQDYASQVHAKMLQNPFDLANDVLYEEWKTVARLAQAMGQIESELQKIYAAAIGLGNDTSLKTTRPRTLVAQLSEEKSPLEVLNEVTATDVVPKRKRKATRVVAAFRSPQRRALRGNAYKVFEKIVKMLDPNDFTKINQSALAIAIDLPKGSIGASMNKLVKDGYLVVGPNGGYRVGTASS